MKNENKLNVSKKGLFMPKFFVTSRLIVQKRDKKEKTQIKTKTVKQSCLKKRWIVQELTKKIGPNCSIFREAQIETSGIFGTVESVISPVLPLFQITSH